MKRVIYVMVLISILVFTTSCQKKQTKDEKVEINKENAIPKELIKINTTIDDIEKALLNIKEQDEKPEELEAAKEKEEMIKNIKDKKAEEKDSKEDTEDDKESKVVETHKEKIAKMWISLEKQSKSIHDQINNYKIKAVEENANEERIKQFEEDLNNLTIFIENKDILNSFISNNQIYDDISYFMSLYEDYKFQIVGLKHDINNIYIYGLKDEWDKALEGISVVNEQYSEIQKQFNKKLKEKDKPSKEDKAKEKDLEKLKYSIDSLEQSLNKKDIKLLEIKRDVVISNLEKLIK